MSFINTNSIVRRLEDFGVKVSEGDITSIELAIEGTENYIKNYCNLDEVPLELYNTAVDICCGTVLKTRQSTGMLDFLNKDGAVSSITEGDVSIAFKSGTSSNDAFDHIIKELINKRGELECFRRLKW